MRGAGARYVPQGAMNALNPVSRLRRQFADLVCDQTGKPLKGEGWSDERTLTAVGLRTGGPLPHELSGGMKQRVCIAMAIAVNPKLIVADESTSALDVVSQRHVLRTLLRSDGVRNIDHPDRPRPGLRHSWSDRIGIMFAGHLVESALSPKFSTIRRHPYTRLLIASLPSIRQGHSPEFRTTPSSPLADGGASHRCEAWRRGDVPARPRYGARSFHSGGCGANRG